MDEAEGKNPATPDTGDTSGTGAETAARRHEATSGDTLSDIQQAESDSSAVPGDASDATGDSAGSASTPAPDGTPDTSGAGTADGRDTGGPM